MRSNASNKSYDIGDQIIFMIDFDSNVSVNGTDSSLILTSTSSNAQLQDATYHSGSDSSTLNYYYTVQANNNGLNIDVGSINLGTSTITGYSSLNAGFNYQAQHHCLHRISV